MSEADYERYAARVPARAGALLHTMKPPAVHQGPKPSKAKYLAKYVMLDGTRFDSKHECEWWVKLRMQEKAGAIINLQRQVSFPLYVDGKLIQRYRCDFWWIEPYGHNVVIADAKSEFTMQMNAWKRTKALFEACYGLKIRELL